MDGNKYERLIVGLDGDAVSVDVYRVLEAFNVSNPQLQHLIKKALCAGLRGHKDTKQDLLDIEASIQSAIVMHDQEIRLYKGAKGNEQGIQKRKKSKAVKG